MLLLADIIKFRPTPSLAFKQPTTICEQRQQIHSLRPFGLHIGIKAKLQASTLKSLDRQLGTTATLFRLPVGTNSPEIGKQAFDFATWATHPTHLPTPWVHSSTILLEVAKN